VSAQQFSPVLITGCSTGIGRATAERLAAAGFTTYATARRLESIQDLEARGCRLLELDVVDDASRRAAVDAIVAEHGAVGALVNNAGYSQSGALETVPLDAIRAQFETNVFGLIALTQLVLPGMRERGSGRIVNLSSMGGKMTLPGGGVYHATKYAVEALSDALRWEVAPFGIDVVIIEPGLIRTEFANTVAAQMEQVDDDGPYARFNQSIKKATTKAYTTGPMAKLGGEPDDVAKVIEQALTAKRPRTRYPVTPSARVFMLNRRMLPDRAWDAMLRRQLPQPGKE
jgi:NAD(P)-dependent dehydrogenase (short-subunit alcohol dehydrogenase family)